MFKFFFFLFRLPLMAAGECGVPGATALGRAAEASSTPSVTATAPCPKTEANTAKGRGSIQYRSCNTEACPDTNGKKQTSHLMTREQCLASLFRKWTTVMKAKCIYIFFWAL